MVKEAGFELVRGRIARRMGADLSSLYWFSPAALIDRVVIIDEAWVFVVERPLSLGARL